VLASATSGAASRRSINEFKISAPRPRKGLEIRPFSCVGGRELVALATRKTRTPSVPFELTRIDRRQGYRPSY
jgi:hypothetical protein